MRITIKSDPENVSVNGEIKFQNSLKVIPHSMAHKEPSNDVNIRLQNLFIQCKIKVLEK